MNIGPPNIISMDKRNLNKLSNQITNNKIRHGSLTKKPSTDLYTVKRKKRSLNKKDTGRRISFLEQQGTIVEESTDSCIVNEKKDTNKLLTKKDNKMITDINNNITYDISNETNSSDKSSHSTVPHLYEKKDLNNLKPKLTNLTSITKRIKKNSLRSSVKFPKSKDLINERSKKNLNNTEKKIRKVRRGRISKKNSTLHSQSNITVESIKSVRQRRTRNIEIPEIYREIILKIREKQEMMKRRYPLRDRKKVHKYDP